MPSVSLQQISSEELGIVLEIQERCYKENFLESEETFKKMLAVFPRGAVFFKADGSIAGYMFFHPGVGGKVKELDCKNLVLSGKENSMYLHDIAILPEWRGKGVTREAIGYFDKQTKEMGFSSQFLVAVQGSESFWKKIGFEKVKEISYAGKKAIFMKRVREQ